MKSQQRLLVKKPCFRKFVHLLNTGKNKVTVFVIQWWAHKVRFFSAKFFSSKVADALNLKIGRKEKKLRSKKICLLETSPKLGGRNANRFPILQ